MHDIVNTCIEFLKLHAAWAGPVMFIVSFGESFVGLSLLFPGTTIMLIAGTLVLWPLNPHGIFNIWPLLIGGICGAVLGDAISFAIGRRFGHLVEKHWYFVRHPDFLARGYKFFRRFGMASVFVGRFFGPVRAAIPLVAGIMEMPWRQFWFANITSALIWAPALLLLGTFFRSMTKYIGAERGWHLAIAVVLVLAFVTAVWLLRRYRVLDRLWGT